MKRNQSLLILFLLLFSLASYAQKELKGTSKIDKVTVFFDRAQVFRSSTVSLTKGKNEIRFPGISTHIDAQSLKVGGLGDFTILSVKYDKDHNQNNSPSETETRLRDKLKQLALKKDLLKLELEVLAEEKIYLKENKKITYEGNALSPENMKAFQENYFSEIKRIQKQDFRTRRSIDSLDLLIRTCNKDINKEISKVKLPDGKIIVTVRANKSLKAKFNLSYMVSNVGWYASYDLRVDYINKPVKLVYKANVFQNTGNDWKNVKLTFSNATPSQNNSLPSMHSYILYPGNVVNYRKSQGYTQRHQNFDPNVRQVSGYIRDASNNEIIPFASIYCPESKVGATSDVNGYYILNLPQGSRTLKVSYVGYTAAHQNIYSGRMDFRMQASASTLDEVVVQSRSMQLVNKKRVRGEIFKDKEAANTVVASAPIENKTSIEFKVDIPYSISSESKAEIITLAEHEIPAVYEYHIRPRHEEAAFLIARITDWEKYNLISGNANLYLESTYVGKTHLDTRFVKDTMDFSLGKDQSIFIKRTRVSTFTQTKVIGGYRVESRAWELQVRNGKSIEIPIVMKDQVPISNRKDIEVKDVEHEGAKHDTKTGYLDYTFKLKPKEVQKFTFKYKVKFPKSYSMQVE